MPNRLQQNPGFSATFTNNRIDGYSYAAAGNLLSDGVNAYTYDAENRVTTVKVNGSLTGTYVYDALGQRVEKITPAGVPSDCDLNGGTVFYIRDLSGHIAVYTSQGVNQCHDYIYAGSRHLVTYRGYAEFTHADWLGTERVRGAQTCTSNPFGDALACSPADNGQYSAHTHFTGKQRDTESNLDYFGARYDSSTMGRFMSPDPLGGHRVDPQTLNKYSYVRNNPVSLTDPTGLDFNLTCQSETFICHNGLVGTYSKPDDNGQRTFTATVISNDKNGDLVDQNGNYYNATITGAGVSFSQDGSNQSGSVGVFINGTNPTTVQGTGDLTGFNFTFTYSNMPSNVTAGGSWTFNGTYQEAEAAISKAGYSSWISHIGDQFDWLHPSGLNFDAVDYRSPGGPNGSNSGHFTVHEPVIQIDRFRIPVTGTVPTVGDVHLGEHNPYTGGWREHLQEVKK